MKRFWDKDLVMLKQNKLYLITINIGSWVHPKLSILHAKESDFEKGYDYWDRSGNYGFQAGDKRKLGAYKRHGCWQFLFEDRNEAQTFLDGAIAAKSFLLSTYQ